MAGVCTALPQDPWREVADQDDRLARLLALGGLAAAELERLERDDPSPLVKGLARMTVESIAVSLPEELAGLASADPTVRGAAARELAKSGKPEQLPLFKRRFVQEDSALVRVHLMDAIAQVGGNAEWKFLSSATRDPDRGVRLRAVELSARLAPQTELIQTALHALKDVDAGVRDRAMGLLMIAGSRRGEAAAPVEEGEIAFDVPEKIALARRLLQERDADLLPLLRRLAAADEPPEVVAEALETLVVVGGVPEADLVRACLERPEPGIQARAFLGLARLGDRRDIDRAAAAVTADTGSVALRAAARVYLGRAEAPRAQVSETASEQEADLDRYVEASLERIRVHGGAGLTLYDPKLLAARRAGSPQDRWLAVSAIVALVGSLAFLARWLFLGLTAQ